ncbi:electron transport complex subunit RsxC [Candidatus Latescibacterota bacterium]
MAGTFNGGVHPDDGRSLSEKASIAPMPLPAEVVIPVAQHIGAPAKVIVEKDQKVLRGQVIAEAGGFVSVPIHASISGTVAAVEPRYTPLGKKAACVVITSDGEDRWADGCNITRDISSLSADDKRNLISDAGIVGMGGATFPTHVKLSPPSNKPIDIVILNGVECEPYATCDHRLMLENLADIIAGLKIIMEILGAKEGFVGIEQNKPDAIKAMKSALKGEKSIRVAELEVKYPMGGEKQLIYAVTRRKVPAGGLPMDVGCVVQNVSTTAAIKRAVVSNIPLIERVVAVTGEGITKPSNIMARIGDSFENLVAFAGGYTEKAAKLIMGGSMMGIAQFTDAVPVIKGTSCLLVFEEDRAYTGKPKPCISCGRCVDVCPMGLMPTTISNFVEFGMLDEAREYGALDCIECGSCSYICPTKRRMVEYIKFGKAQLMAIRTQEQAKKRAAEEASKETKSA